MVETLQLHVTGMTCGGCENAVTRTLLKVDGVDTVTASHVSERVDVSYDPAKVPPALIKEKIEALGYAVPSSASIGTDN